MLPSPGAGYWEKGKRARRRAIWQMGRMDCGAAGETTWLCFFVGRGPGMGPVSARVRSALDTPMPFSGVGEAVVRSRQATAIWPNP